MNEILGAEQGVVVYCEQVVNYRPSRRVNESVRRDEGIPQKGIMAQKAGFEEAQGGWVR